MNFDSLFADPRGRTARGPFFGALAVLVAAAAFYALLTRGRNSEWVLLTLLFPAFVLHARRLHDMGRSAWLLLVPLAVALAAFAVWMRLVSLGAGLDGLLAPAAIALGPPSPPGACSARARTRPTASGRSRRGPRRSSAACPGA